MLNLLQTFAQDTLNDPMTYSYSMSDSSTSAGFEMSPVFWIIYIVFIVLMFASLWRMFTKAGEAGWKAIVPIYNFVVLLKIVGRPTWWILLILVGVIPFVGWIVSLVVSIIISHDTSKSYGKDIGTTLLLIFLPFIGYPLLAWGDAKYVGPSALKGGSGGADAGTPGTPTNPTTPVNPVDTLK